MYNTDLPFLSNCFSITMYNGGQILLLISSSFFFPFIFFFFIVNYRVMIIIILFSQYLERFPIPCLAFNRSKKCHVTKFPIFKLFPVSKCDEMILLHFKCVCVCECIWGARLCVLEGGCRCWRGLTSTPVWSGIYLLYILVKTLLNFGRVIFCSLNIYSKHSDAWSELKQSPK